MNPKLDVPEEVVTHVANALGITTKAGVLFLNIALENCRLMEQKQRDYGTRNISGFGAYGCIVRASDKFERLKNLYTMKRRKPINESIHDTYRDIANYALIALMCEKKVWPND